MICRKGCVVYRVKSSSRGIESERFFVGNRTSCQGRPDAGSRPIFANAACLKASASVVFRRLPKLYRCELSVKKRLPVSHRKGTRSEGFALAKPIL